MFPRSGLNCLESTKGWGDKLDAGKALQVIGNNMQILQELIPAKARKWVYGVFALVALGLGALDVFWSGSGAPEWLDGALRVVSYLSGPLAVLAGSNVSESEFIGRIDPSVISEQDVPGA